MDFELINVGRYQKWFAIETPSGNAIAPIDDLLCLGVEFYGKWGDLPSVETRKFQFGAGSSPFLGSLESNEFSGGFNFACKPSKRFVVGAVPRFNHEGRCVSLLDPVMSYDNQGLLQPLADLAATVSNWLMPSPHCREAGLMCLDYARRSGWQRCVNLGRFSTICDIADRETPIRGIIKGVCENWVDSLVIATLTSAGYFVVVDGPNGLVPGVAMAAQSGIFPLISEGGVVGPSSLVLCGLTYDIPARQDNSRCLLIGPRRFSEMKKQPYFVARSDSIIKGLRKVHVLTAHMGVAMYHYVPSDPDLDAIPAATSFEMSPDDAERLVNLPISKVLSLFDNLMTGAPWEGVEVSYTVCDDDYNDGVKESVIDDRVEVVDG